MDKQRRPNVVRTWTVERTKVRYPSPPPPVKLRSRSQKDLFRGQERESDPPSAPATQG
jgi:hypothetical protein